jgi:hypothetical protein
MKFDVKSTSFDLLVDQMDIHVHPRLTHLPLIVKIEEEDDRQFNVLAALFMVTFRGALPNGAVALHQTGLFNVRPVA